jgi:predicted RNase H-like HicB family nuclease
MDEHEYKANIHLFFSEEDEGYIAKVLTLAADGKTILEDFICISAFGKTPGEVLRELGDALEMCLEVWEEDQKGGGE